MTHEFLPSAQDDLVQARLSGTMTPADQRAFESLARKLVDAGGKVRLLVTLDGFEGWEKGAGWGDDLEFQFGYGNEIVRIAVVGDAIWKEQALMYLGKGFRDTGIEFFPPHEMAAARAWVDGG